MKVPKNEEMKAAELAVLVKMRFGGVPGLRSCRDGMRDDFRVTPDAIERTDCTAFLKTHTLAELCRALMNLNAFAYVD